jgi:predicted  nucleic acid-binding Zn-ribbon protein
VSESAALLVLSDLHLLDAELGDARAQARLRKLGLAMAPHKDLERTEQRVTAVIDRRWTFHYDRARRRYGRGLVAVRERVCLGCRIQLPTSKTPSAAGALTLCESCGRVLYWG